MIFLIYLNYQIIKKFIMQKNIFKNYANLIISTLLLALAGMSCQKTATQPTINSGIIATSTDANARTASLATIPLKVTVSDADANNVPYNIQSDGKGVYINGKDYVQAIIDQSGTFAFNTMSASNSRTAALRWVSYNFNNPVNAANTYRPAPSNSKNYHFSTGSSTFGTQPFIPLQNLGVNANPATECIYMGNGIYNSTTGWRISFHKGYENVANSPTAFAVVTRTSISPAVWNITPVGTCSANSNVAALRSDDGTFLYGNYYIPFFFTLTAQ